MQEKIKKTVSENSQLSEEQSIALIHCLEPLLKALGWPGERRHLLEAIPYFTDKLNINDFLQTMHALRYQYSSFNINVKLIDPAFVPCLFMSNTHQVMLILDKTDKEIFILDGSSAKEKKIPLPSLNGTVYYFQRMESMATATYARRAHWFKHLLNQFNRFFYSAFFASFVANTLSLSIPLFSMIIYDQVIPSKSQTLLNEFTIGVLITIVGIAILQLVQSKLLAFVGRKINNKVGNAVLERLLFLPASYTESASVSAQIARIRDFDNIRDFFTGPLFNLVFELPFAILFLATIAILGGTLVFIPLIMISVYLVLFYFLRPAINARIEQSAKNASDKQELTLEALRYIRTLKYTGTIPTWCHRYRTLAAKSALANFKNNMMTTFVNTISDLLMMLTALSIISFGAIKILSNNITVGALIAIMMLVWRVLSPMKMLFANQTRISQFQSSIRQLNALMLIEVEREPSVIATPLNHFHGNVRFNRVTLRYPNTLDPALMNTSFIVNTGEVVAITGRNGSGKSTIFNLLLGLYKPQAGTIYIDHQDIRQMDPFELRNAIGYVSQKPSIFYGTIAQNLYLANLIATEKELMQAIEYAHLTEDIAALPHGLNTHLDDQIILNLPSSFMQRLALAQNYLKHPAIILLDEPANTLDQAGEAALLKAIKHFRGHSTIFIITHRPSHLKAADKIILLHEGQLLLAGQTNQILPRLPKEFLQ